MDESTKLEFESMGLKGSVANPPRTPEDWVEQAGPNGKSLIATAISNVKAHQIMGDFRSDIMDAVYEATKVEPKTKDKLDDKNQPVKDSAGNTVQVWNEQPEPYVSRVAASLGKSVTDAFQSIATDWSNQHSFKEWLVPGAARVGGAGVKDREEAGKILADPSRLARVRTALSQNGINIPEVVDASQLALAIRDLRNKLAQAAIS